MPRLSRRSYAWLFLVLIAALYLRASNITQPGFTGSTLGFNIVAAPKGGLIGGYDTASGSGGPPFGHRSPTANQFSWPSSGLMYSLGFCTSVASGAGEIAAIQWQKTTPSGTVAEHEDLVSILAGPNAAQGCVVNTMTTYPILEFEKPEMDFTPSSGGAPRKRGWSSMLLWNVNQPQGAFGAAAVGAGVTRFTANGQQGSFGTAAVENDVSMPIPYDVTARKLCAVTTTAQPATGSLVLTFRDSGVNTALVLTIAASAAADTYCASTALSAALVANDFYSISMLNNAGTASATMSTISWEFVPVTTGRAMVTFPKFNNALAAGATEYTSAHVTITGSATEAEFQSPMPYGGTMQNFKCFVGLAPATNNTVVRVFRNGGASGITQTITPGGGTGVLSGTGTQTFTTPASLGIAPADSFSIEYVTGAGAVPEIGGCAAEYVWSTT